MAKATDDETKRKPKRAQTTLTWLMTGMLILGLGGFGVTNFNSTLTSIGSVGSTDLSAQDYARTLRQQVDGLSQQFGTPVTVQQAIGFGIDRQALAALVSRATLDEAARGAGLSVGDQIVAGEVMKEKAFIGASGAFDANIYRETLRRSGWNEQEYEASLRGEVTRSLLSGAVTGGFVAPDPVIESLLQWVAERRGFSMIRLTEADLAEALPEPSEDDLRAYYEANIETFTKPEAKRIRYALLLPSHIAGEQPVDEALLKQLYDQRIAEFVIPSRRLVERLVYPDQAAAEAALAKVKAGTSFEDLVAERGLTMDAADMGDMAESELGQAGAAIFAADLDSVVLAETDLGPALFRVNGELAGEETSFEDAKPKLAEELQYEEASRIINDKIDAIDDMLADDISLSELAKSMGMTEGSVDYVATAQGSDPVEGYEAFRQAAAALKEGDFPQAVILDDGGVVVPEFVEIVPPAPIPFEEAKEAVQEKLEAERLREALQARAEAFKTEAEGGAPLATLSIVDVTRAITREGSVAKAPASLVSSVFEMAEGEYRVVSEGDFIALVHLDSIAKADPATEEAAALKSAISAQLEQAMARDAFQAFTDAASLKAGIIIDQNAVNLVNSSLQ